MEQLDIKNYGLREEPELWKIIGSSKEIKEVIKGIQTVLESDVPVVIQGETGTGKELVAKAIHYRGPRRKHAFCAINCAAIPENLLESELMGHEKGAFTGAIQQHVGKLERSNMGTLFLDEIIEMPQVMQTKILRVIEEQVFERVGENDLRMIESLESGLSTLEAALRRGEVLPLSEVEEIFIRRALNATNGNISAAAEKLGISRSTVYRKMQELGINTG